MGFKGKSLVVFGCGYVGKALVRQALERGLQVTALTRNPQIADELESMGPVRVVCAELDSEMWHGEISPEQDLVVNCVSSAGGGLEGYRKSYVEGNRSILKWTAGGRVGTFVYTSSTSVYPQSGGETVDEAASTTGVSERGGILLEAENLIKENAKVFECWFILRLAGIYGPGRHYLLDQLRAGELVFAGSGEHTLNLIHRDDICAALWAALEAPEAIRNEIFNVADDNPRPKCELVEWLARELQAGKPAFNPDKVSIRRRTAGGVIPDRRISNAKLKRVLGWEPEFPSFKEGYTSILNSVSA